MAPRSPRKQLSLPFIPRLKSSIVFLLNGLLLFALTRVGSAQTIWNTQSGDWFQTTNWSDGVPDSATDAQVNNGGTPQVDAAAATANNLTLGFDAGDSGNLIVSGTGNLQVTGELGGRSGERNRAPSAARQSLALPRMTVRGPRDYDLRLRPANQTALALPGRLETSQESDLSRMVPSQRQIRVVLETLLVGVAQLDGTFDQVKPVIESRVRIPPAAPDSCKKRAPFRHQSGFLSSDGCFRPFEFVRTAHDLVEPID